MDAAGVGRRHEGRADGDVLDVAARELEAAGEEVEVHVVGDGRGVGEVSPPEAIAVGLLGKGKLDRQAHPPEESLVDVLPQVRGEDDNALELLDALEQVTRFNVGVAVVRVLDLGALAEERVGLVEEEDGVRVFGLREDAREILFGLADVLADDR